VNGRPAAAAADLSRATTECFLAKEELSGDSDLQFFSIG